MSVLCKFAYELTLGLLHSCSPNVRKKKGYRMAKPGLFFAIFFSKCYFSTRSFICTCGKKSFGQAEIRVWSQPECCGNKLKGRNIFKHCMVCSWSHVLFNNRSKGRAISWKKKKSSPVLYQQQGVYWWQCLSGSEGFYSFFFQAKIHCFAPPQHLLFVKSRALWPQRNCPSPQQ